jgi:hypothetical protein
MVPSYIWIDLGPAPGTQLAGQIVLNAATEHVVLPATTTIATFTDTNTNDAASGFTATINWGDTTTSTGTVTGSNGSFVVTGGHTYAGEGTAPVSVTITRTADNTQTTPSANVVVGENDALTGQGTTINADLSLSVFGTVATFTDTDTVSPASDFTATIHWGDGSTDIGAVSGSNGSFQVSGLHTYALGTSGNETVTVSLADKAPGTATATALTTVVLPPTVTISDATPVDDGSPSSPGTANFTVTLDHASTTELTFNVIVNPLKTAMLDTAQLIGDIGSYSNLLTIPAGTRTATLQVPLVGDTQIEPQEQFAVQLTTTADENVIIGQGDVMDTNGIAIPGTAIGTILGDGSLASNVKIEGLSQAGLPQKVQDLLTCDLEAAAARIENSLGGVAGSVPQFDIQVTTADLGGAYAQGGPANMTDAVRISGQSYYLPNTLVEHLTGVDPNGASTPDILLTLSNNVNDGVLTWFSGRSTVDVVTMLTHELLHGMGFGIGYGTGSGLALAGNPQTIWDSFLAPPNRTHGYRFEGTQTIDANVLLANAGSGPNGLVTGLGHVGVQPDLMDPYVGANGNPYAMFDESISPLDIAILKDIGYGTTAPTWFNTSKPNQLIASNAVGFPFDASTPSNNNLQLLANYMAPSEVSPYQAMLNPTSTMYPGPALQLAQAMASFGANTSNADSLVTQQTNQPWAQAFLAPNSLHHA